MATLTLQVENPSILAHLRAVLKSIKGVKVLSSENTSMNEVAQDDVPNAVTLAAMKEAESGDDGGIVATDSLESFIKSME